MRLILLLFILITGIFFYFPPKSIIFVRLSPYRTVFALYYVQFEKRKLPVGYFKLHRLLYFTRAVVLPAPAESHRAGAGKEAL